MQFVGDVRASGLGGVENAMAFAVTMFRAARAGLGGLGFGRVGGPDAPHAAAEPEVAPADPPPPLAIAARAVVLPGEV